MTGSISPLNDAEAFSQLYTRSHMIVFRFIYGLHGGPNQEVEDLTSETFMRAWNARHRFEGDHDAALSWLLKIARNLVIDTHRRSKSRGILQDIDDPSIHLRLSNPDGTPEEITAAKEKFNTLWNLLLSLPAEKREIITLRYILGWPVKRIATHLERNENTISVNLRRILIQLRRDWPE